MADIRINALATTAASTASDDFLAVDGSSQGTRKLNAYSPTFGGNLTVSGTGTNYFVGDITSTATGNNQWQITKGAATNYATLVFSESTSGAAWAIGQRTTAAAGGANRLSFYGSGIGGDAMQITYLGNLLIGTTTDSSNGKLQLATHTTSAGGIGFGTDVSLYRQDANTLVVQPTGSSKKVLFYGDSTVSGLFNSLSSYEAIYFDPSTHSIKLATNGFTALTLDTSQNATFAGAVTAGGNVNLAVGKLLTLNGNATAGSYALQAATGSAPYDFRFIGASDSGTQRYFSFGYYTGDNIANAWNEKARINSYTGDATFVGSIAIGNTVQTAASVASTHKVTIYIGGTAYYLLATNV